MKKIMITGVAGFIGFHLAKNLLATKKYNVFGIDSLNNYYSPAIKKSRLSLLATSDNFSFAKLDICNFTKLDIYYKQCRPDYIVHLAAEAGVRHSIENPHVFKKSNLDGFLNLIEVARMYSVKHFVFASSSSVYGLNDALPIAERSSSDHQTSLYAATKKSNEMIAHSYAHSLGVPSTGLRFFSVYGPWGRPDMAYWAFTEKIANNKPIQLFNRGNHKRDMIYIDDLVKYITKVLAKPPKKNVLFNPKKPDASISSAPYRILNLGTGKPTSLFQLVSYIEKAMQKKAIIQLKPKQKADSLDTRANPKAIITLTGYTAKTSTQDGIAKFVNWYKTFTR